MSSPYRDVATIQNIANSSTIIEHRDDANEEGVHKFRNENNVDPDVEHPDDHESARTRLRGTSTSKWSHFWTMLTTDNLLGPLVNDGDYSVYAAVYIYLGCMYVIFGIIQIGLGASVFGYFDNVKLGAWWVGVIIVLAAFLWQRVYLSYLTACIAAATALIGTILDGISSVHFRSITACASQHNDASEILYYGSPDHYSLAMTCLKKASDIVSDGCYCVSLKSRSCNEYTLSNFRVGVNDDCGTIMTTYSMTMTASCIFCVFCFILALSRIFATYYNQNPRKILEPQMYLS